MRCQWLVATLAVGIGVSACGQEGDRPLDANESETAVASFVEQARQYAFSADGKRFTFRERPVLNWGNPARGSENGSIFVWTDRDAPVIIGTCFTYQSNGVERKKNAFLLLSTDPVEGRHRDRLMWRPDPVSLTYQRVPEAPPVGITAAQRTTQLRAMARRFGAVITLQDGRTEQCRLIPQPLYRFDSGDHAGPCGAVFSMAVGTDPEAILVIKRQHDDVGESTWHYVFGRFTFYPVEGTLDGQSVWKVQLLENMVNSILTRPDYQRERYITFRPDWLD